MNPNTNIVREVSDVAGIDPKVTEEFVTKSAAANERIPIRGPAKINPDFFNSVCDGAGIDPAVIHETLQRINK